MQKKVKFDKQKYKRNSHDNETLLTFLIFHTFPFSISVILSHIYCELSHVSRALKSASIKFSAA